MKVFCLLALFLALVSINLDFTEARELEGYPPSCTPFDHCDPKCHYGYQCCKFTKKECKKECTDYCYAKDHGKYEPKDECEHRLKCYPIDYEKCKDYDCKCETFKCGEDCYYEKKLVCEPKCEVKKVCTKNVHCGGHGHFKKPCHPICKDVKVCKKECKYVTERKCKDKLCKKCIYCRNEPFCGPKCGDGYCKYGDECKPWCEVKCEDKTFGKCVYASSHHGKGKRH